MLFFTAFIVMMMAVFWLFGNSELPYKQEICVEIAYLVIELPNKSAKTFLFASSTFLLSGTM